LPILWGIFQKTFQKLALLTFSGCHADRYFYWFHFLDYWKLSSSASATIIQYCHWFPHFVHEGVRV
jgi:hypothetical protein